MSTAPKEIEAPIRNMNAKKRTSARSFSSLSEEQSTKHKRRKKHKKRSRVNTTGSNPVDGKVLSGMILAVSTLQNEPLLGSENGTNKSSSVPTERAKIDTTPSDSSRRCELPPQQLSYKTVTNYCYQAGATVSSQVHKKVQCVLCTPAAVIQATQRVRKAQKKSIPLVDVAWLWSCLQQSKRLDFDAYLLDYPTKVPPPTTTSKSDDSNSSNGISSGEVHVESVDVREIPEDAGWSEAVDVGCCCVCHENGDTDCPWCVNCNQ